ncbi:MAG: glycosyltransferase [Bacteroidales bacterium]|nr:glycosyltransferase [Bacteroidales bacterium]MCM1206057.1 glycosyltransferase [Bacillota bacterium]MCM1511040.1 glycosyltransferase [Clostridium sp.]
MLSIIIPVYNVEKYLDRCLESVVAQSFRDWEIILVDDGSPDSCPAMCDRWAERDGRIRAVHKTNGGLSSARNLGMELAAGDHVTFIDSDDELAPETLAPLMTILRDHPEYDILEYSVHQDFGHPRGRDSLYRPEERTYGNFKDYWACSCGYEHCWACNKILRAGLLDGNPFAAGRCYEDVLLMGKLAAANPVIHTTPQGLYLYRYNENGLSKAYDLTLLQLLEAQKAIAEQLAVDFREKKWHRLYMRMLNVQIDVCKLNGNIILPECRVDVRNYFGFTSLVKSLLLRCLGLRITCRVMRRIRS